MEIFCLLLTLREHSWLLVFAEQKEKLNDLLTNKHDWLGRQSSKSWNLWVAEFWTHQHSDFLDNT